ncbi:MAG: AzlC family ABC transporter permease [Ruminococcaceae bacterium]|nr:AzlC family ABC transporter permease [Oscillospiraceae bacterium]
MTNEKSQNSYMYGLGKGLPIALGYLSVSFGFGITAVGQGIDPLGTILISLTNLTSAGQVAGVAIMAAGGTLIEMILTQLIINIRYCLMALALTQKLDGSFTTLHRFVTAFGITDENFGVAAAEKGLIGRRFMYGLITLPIVGWTLGTTLGVYANQILPPSVCAALGIAIYSMFMAIIIPPSRDDKGVLVTVAIASLLSCIFYYVPYLNRLSQGFSIIICAFVAAGLMAWVVPRTMED